MKLTEIPFVAKSKMPTPAVDQGTYAFFDTENGDRMTFVKNVAGASVFFTLPDGSVGTYEIGVTAYQLGGQPNATSLTKNFSRIDICAGDNDSIKMPEAIAGYPEYLVVNNTANIIEIFPNEGNAFEGLANNASLLIEVGGSLRLFCFENGVWHY